MKMLKIIYILILFIMVLPGNIGATMLCKVDTNGQVLWIWQKWAGYSCYINKMTIASDGSIYATDTWFGGIYRFSADGTLLWQRIIYLPDSQDTDGLGGQVADLWIDDDGDIFATGNYVASTGWSGFVARISTEGEMVWAKGANIADNAYSQNSSQIIRMDQERNLYIGGEVVKKQKIDECYDYFVAKYDEEGRKEWTVINDVIKGDDLRWIEVTEDGDVYAAGYSYEQILNKTTYYFVVFKINRDGKLLWTTYYSIGECYTDENNLTLPIISGKERDESSIGVMKAGLDGEGLIHLIGTSWPGIENKQIQQITVDPDGNNIEEIIYPLDWSISYLDFDFEPDEDFDDIYGAVTISEISDRSVFFRVHAETGVVWSVTIEDGYEEAGSLNDVELFQDELYVVGYLEGIPDLYRINKEGAIVWRKEIDSAITQSIEVKDGYIYLAGTSTDDDDSSGNEDDDDDNDDIDGNNNGNNAKDDDDDETPCGC